MQLHYKTYGQGEPLVILHGLFGMLDNWQSISKRLAERFLIVACDLRNHGRSGHSDEFNYSAMAQDVLETMHSIGMYRGSVLGHSMGGKVAMHMATEDPDSVERLISVDIAPKQYLPGHADVIRALQSVNLGHTESRSEVTATLMNGLDDLTVTRFLMKNLKRVDRSRFAWRMNLPVIIGNYQEVITGLPDGAEYDGPSLFIRGERSQYIKDQDWAHVLEIFPNARLETAPGAGHWVHADNPDVLVSLVEQFMLEM